MCAKRPVKVFGNSGKGTGAFIDPAGIVVDRAGYMIIADARNHRLQVEGLAQIPCFCQCTEQCLFDRYMGNRASTRGRFRWTSR